MAWLICQYFSLVPSSPASNGAIFEFAQYFSILALLIAVFLNADFKFRYRMSLSRLKVRETGFYVSFAIGITIFFIDVWYENHLPVPLLLVNENNLKAVVGLSFIVFVFVVIRNVIVGPIKFKKSNSGRFADANIYFIHQGNEDRMIIIAEELQSSLPMIVKLSGQISDADTLKKQLKTANEDANVLMHLFADERFCKIVVEHIPSFPLQLFNEVQRYPEQNIPVYQFARNVGRAFILDTNSAFYQEDSGYFTGYFGYTRPVTKLIFGNFEFIERCAADGASPLDVGFEYIGDFNKIQMSGLLRASTTFLEAYLVRTKGSNAFHSYAFTRLLHAYQSALHATYLLDGSERYFERAEFHWLQTTTEFIKNSIQLLERYANPPSTLRTRNIAMPDAYDKITELLFECIFAASAVRYPVATAWSVQHNTVWHTIAGLHSGPANNIVAHKIRRKLFTEVKNMDRFANFKGARILGFCLNVLGLELVDRHKGFMREWYPLQSVILKWVTQNYRRLRENHPKVAEACLTGSITYDVDGHCLVKTYSNDTGKEPDRHFLVLD